jgi:hypothetical protein
MCLLFVCWASNFAFALKNFRRNFGLFLAVVVAGTDVFLKKIRLVLKGRERLRPALWDLLAQAKGLWQEIRLPQQVSDETVAERMRVCRNCPVFFKPLQTCGSPLQKRSRVMLRIESFNKSHLHPDGNLLTQIGLQPQVGCFCFMPSKSRIRENCWAYDARLQLLGWPEPLNGWPRRKLPA